jgi:hypothetical protein
VPQPARSLEGAFDFGAFRDRSSDLAIRSAIADILVEMG